MEYIFETAGLNGYNDSTVKAIIDKKKRDLFRKSMTTLATEQEELKRVADDNITKPLKSKF